MAPKTPPLMAKVMKDGHFFWNPSHRIYLFIVQGDSGGALTVNGVFAGISSRIGSDDCAKVLFSCLLSRFLRLS